MKAYVLIAVCTIVSSACAGGLLVGMMVSARMFGFSCRKEPDWFLKVMQAMGNVFTAAVVILIGSALILGYGRLGA